MKNIEAFIKVTIEEEKNDCGLYGEYLEKIFPQIKKDGIYLEDYAVLHHDSACEEEMYFNYLMNHILKNTYDTNITFMSFEEWQEEQKNNSLAIIETVASGGSYKKGENYMNINKILPNELLPVFDKVAQKMNLDFKDGFLDDDFETDYCITRPDLPECTEDEIETCKMDWIHSIKEDFLYAVISEIHPNITVDNSEKYYEQYYDEVFDYLIDKTFEK